MSEDIKQRIANRRKCAYAMKRFNIRIFIIAIVILCAWCGFLLAKVCILEQMLQQTNELLAEQQSILQEIADEMNLSSNGADESDRAGAIASGQEETDLTGNEALDGENSDGADSDSEIPEDEMTVVETGHRVHLTFDDGPSIYTREILDILDQYNVKATFFVVGKEDAASEDLLWEIVDRGHSLGMHSYSHDYDKLYASVDAFAEDFNRLQEYLYDVTGVKSKLYRFPGGSSNTRSTVPMQEFADYLQEQGVTFYDWNISSGDGSSIPVPVETLVENCTKDIAQWNTAIVLMHDSADKRTTVDALPTIIENILAVEDTVIVPITEETKPVQHITQ